MHGAHYLLCVVTLIVALIVALTTMCCDILAISGLAKDATPSSTINLALADSLRAF